MSGCWNQCCLYWGSYVTVSWFIFSAITRFMRCYNVVQATGLYALCRTLLGYNSLNNECVVIRKCCLYWGLYVTLTSPLIRFLNYYTSCGAITWYRLRLYALVPHTKLQLIMSGWEIENVVYTGAPNGKPLTSPRFDFSAITLRQWITCHRLKLYALCRTQSYSS
jgi:hypothetical protein